MATTLHGLEISPALSLDDVMELRRRIVDTAMLSLVSGRPERVNVLTIGGHSHCIEISTVISMPEMNRNGGDDKA